MNLLNVGCGRRTHPAWVNVDAIALAPGVRRCDVRRGLPFPAGRFAAVYHSHVLEHLDREGGRTFLRECHRVLAPGGIIRVAVPDLEGIARAYLAALEDARAGIAGAVERRDWMELELVDQAARHRSAGEVPSFLARCSAGTRRFARERWGAELDQLLAPGREVRPSFRTLAAGLSWRPVARAVGSLLGGERWRVGDFRLRGEVHLRMFDAVSLSLALGEAGFAEARSTSAVASWIPGWREFELDADADGRPHKPDSVYVEARKPDGGAQ